MLYHLGGVPVVNYDNNKFITGTVFFVDSNNGSAGASGLKPTEALTTLDAALGKCTDSKGDVIYLMPGHAETITGAGGITLDKIGVSIIGLGRYDLRPRFLMDGGATVTMLVTAANVSIENCVFAAGHADIVTFCTISAKGFRCAYCHFEENVATENFLTVISAGVADNDSDGLEVIGCTFNSIDSAATGVIKLNKNMADVKIVGNQICCDCSASTYAPIYSPSTEVITNILVSDNIVHNLHDGNATVGISIANTASTGAIVRNLVGAQDLADETPILGGAAGLFVAENYASGVLGTASGYLYPAVDS